MIHTWNHYDILYQLHVSFRKYTLEEKGDNLNLSLSLVFLLTLGDEAKKKEQY